MSDLDVAIATTRARNALHTIIDLWPLLLDRLAHTATAQERIAGSSDAPLPINVKISDFMAEVNEWARDLAQTLIEESRWEPPADQSPPALLEAIAAERIGHFTGSQDAVTRTTITLDAEDFATRITRQIFGTTCPIHGGTCIVNHRATRIRCRAQRCPGTYRLPVDHNRRPGEPEPDLICSANPTHRVARLEWETVGRDPNYIPESCRPKETPTRPEHAHA